MLQSTKPCKVMAEIERTLSWEYASIKWDFSVMLKIAHYVRKRVHLRAVAMHPSQGNPGYRPLLPPSNFLVNKQTQLLFYWIDMWSIYRNLPLHVQLWTDISLTMIPFNVNPFSFFHDLRPLQNCLVSLPLYLHLFRSKVILCFGISQVTC